MKKKMMSAVTISCVGLVAALNVSEAFSDVVVSIPVVGDIAKNVTVRELKKAKEPVNINIKKYKIEGLDEELESSIRSLISDKIKELSDLMMEEYKVMKKEYIALGNKEKNYIKPQIDIDVKVKLVSDEVVSFIISKYDSEKKEITNVYPYNINMSTKSNITLKDIFGIEYRDVVAAGVDKYIDSKSVKNKEIAEYYEKYYKTRNIEYSEQTPFYLNEKGNPVLMFNEREIAPREFGKQNVEIEV